MHRSSWDVIASKNAISGYRRILGVPEPNLVWTYLNKGTHEEADRDDFASEAVETVVQTFEALDAVELRPGPCATCDAPRVAGTVKGARTLEGRRELIEAGPQPGRNRSQSMHIANPTPCICMKGDLRHFYDGHCLASHGTGIKNRARESVLRGQTPHQGGVSGFRRRPLPSDLQEPARELAMPRILANKVSNVTVDDALS